MTPEARLSAISNQVEEWRKRCLDLARQGKYWEAARLNEAANEIADILSISGGGPAIRTDQDVKDAYDRAKRLPPHGLPQGPFTPFIPPSQPNWWEALPPHIHTRITD